MNYVRNSGIVTITGVQISYGNALKISQLLNFTLILAFESATKLYSYRDNMLFAGEERLPHVR